MNILLIDDVRDMACDKVARTYEEGIECLKSKKWDLLLLDHDLGEEKTGYDVMCWLEENTQHLPNRIELVTANPVGRKRMLTVINKLYERSSNENKYI